MEQKQLKQFTFYDLYWDLMRQSGDASAGRLVRNICLYMFTIDTLPFDTKFRERKLRDLNARLDGMYETIAELEKLIGDAKLQKKAMEEEAVTLENIYRILLNFSEFFDIIDEDERKNLLCYLIKEIQLNPHWENKSPLKWIEFNFPIYRNGEEVRKVLCEENPNVETLVVLSRKYDK